MLKIILLVMYFCSASCEQGQLLDTLLTEIQRNSNTSEQNSITTIPNLNIDIVTMLKLLAKYEVQEEALKIKQTLKEEMRKLKEAGDATLKMIKGYPSSNLDLVTLGAKKYFFSVKQKLSWMEAVMFCRLHGMEIVTVETKEESDLIYGKIREFGLTGSWLFMSANKIGSAKLKWLTGEEVTYVDWLPAHPHDTVSRHCMMFVGTGWADITCDVLANFICEEQ